MDVKPEPSGPANGPAAVKSETPNQPKPQRENLNMKNQNQNQNQNMGGPNKRNMNMNMNRNFGNNRGGKGGPQGNMGPRGPMKNEVFLEILRFSFSVFHPPFFLITKQSSMMSLT